MLEFARREMVRGVEREKERMESMMNDSCEAKEMGKCLGLLF